MALHTLVKQTTKDTEDITSLIRSALERGCERKPPLTSDDWLRGSSIGKLCPRQEVLCARTGAVREDNISGDLGMVFEIGHAIHWVMQNRVLSGHGLVGRWRCTWCGESYGSFKEGLVRRPESCIRCGAIAGDEPRIDGRPDKTVRANAFFYVEQWVGDKQHRVGGHPDGFLVGKGIEVFTMKDLILLEFKSASSRTMVGFKKAPDFMHVIQCQIYMWLTGCRRAKVVYIDKGTFGLAALAQHDLDYDTEIVERVKEAIASVWEGIAGGEIPKREMCAVQSCPRAQGCIVSDACFS